MDESRQELLSCIHCDKSELLGTDATDRIGGVWAVPGKTPREILMILWDNAKAEYESRRRARRQRLPAPETPQPRRPEPRQPTTAETEATAALVALGEPKKVCGPAVTTLATEDPTLDCAGIIRAYYQKRPLFAAAGA